MARNPPKKGRCINPEMTVLDGLSRYRQTVTVFKKYHEHAGTCICCESLFEPLENVAAKHGLVLQDLLIELENVVGALTDERDMKVKNPRPNDVVLPDRVNIRAQRARL